MAPGGFTWGTLQYNRDAIAYGIALPSKIGGYKNWFALPPKRIKFADITMLANEFGIKTIPMSHPDHALFLTEHPFADQRFQLIFCGGAVLRSHERSDHRRGFERTRLTNSQLILAMQRIIPGGTMVVSLRRPDAWEIAHLLHQFNSFANIQLFKPYKKHAVRSTFYLVAKNVQSKTESAKAALEEWRESWFRATFGGDEGTGERDPEMEVDAVKAVLNDFGSKLIELAVPVWKIQATALEYRRSRRSLLSHIPSNIILVVYRGKIINLRLAEWNGDLTYLRAEDLTSNKRRYNVHYLTKPSA